MLDLHCLRCWLTDRRLLASHVLLLILMFSGCVLTFAQDTFVSLAAASDANDGQLSARKTAACPVNAFVVGVRKIVIEKITNLGVICRVPVTSAGIWSNQHWSVSVEEPMSDTAQGLQEDICQANSYVVAVDIALRKYSRQDAPLGPTLHFVEPADI